LSRERRFRRGGRRVEERDLRHWQDRLHDIMVASRECLHFTDGMTLEQFQADLKTRKAVQMNLIIIGEAARFTPPRIAARATGVPWEDLRELRNFVVHVYFRVESRLVWETVRGELPGVIHNIDKMLAETR
jgi:uncharacterized protein with HEPN domain